MALPDGVDQPTLPGVAKCGPAGASPLEDRLLRALIASGYFREAQVSSDVVVAVGPLGLVLRELPVTVGGSRYRLDFAIIGTDGSPGLAIEVDGHEFHSSKEQVLYDRRRERALTAAGWTVLRFTGSEVHRDAAACVAEAVGLLERRALAGAGGGR